MTEEDEEFNRIERESMMRMKAVQAVVTRGGSRTTIEMARGAAMDEPTYTFKQSSEPVFAFKDIKPNYNMTFNRDGKQIGVLDFNGPEMAFTGDADESAKVFFDFIARSFKERLEQERADERELMSARIKELEHQAARYKLLRTWDLGGYDHGLYSPEEVDKAVDDCIKGDA